MDDNSILNSSLYKNMSEKIIKMEDDSSFLKIKKWKLNICTKEEIPKIEIERHFHLREG